MRSTKRNRSHLSRMTTGGDRNWYVNGSEAPAPAWECDVCRLSFTAGRSNSRGDAVCLYPIQLDGCPLARLAAKSPISSSGRRPSPRERAAAS